MAEIFLSHSSLDKPFARRLGNDLQKNKLKVWIDEAEINVGDSLIDKISNGIINCDFLIVLLSKSSVNSEWVKRELNIALTREINGKKIVVLPCLIDNCEIPIFLSDRKYADFRLNESYTQMLDEILHAVGKAYTNTSNDKENQHGNSTVTPPKGKALIDDSAIRNLKIKLGQDPLLPSIKFSDDAVVYVIEQSIKPLAKAWERKLQELDSLFFARTNSVSDGSTSKKGENMFLTLEKVVGGDLPRLKVINKPTTKELKLHASLQRLRTSNSNTNFNGGTITIAFHSNVYEIIYTGTKKSIANSYNQHLTKEEIESIVSTMTTWLLRNIENATD